MSGPAAIPPVMADSGRPDTAPPATAPPATAPLTATRDAPLGGQAVLEGVMMRGIGHWAVAVRAPVPEVGTDGVAAVDGASAVNGAEAEGSAAVDGGAAEGSAAVDGGAAEGSAAVNGGEPLGEILVQRFTISRDRRRRRLYRLPVLRGVVALVESLGIGLRALSISANAQLGESEVEISGGAWAGTVIVSLVFAIGLFFVVPVGLTSLIKAQLGTSVVFWLVEGIVRTAIFLGYLTLLSRLRDLRRVFEYHGAEHKVISCYEAGEELTPHRAARYSRLHPRCGTSFLLIVMIVAIFVFAPVGLPVWWVLVLTRILGVPVIAGISFEIIKWAGRHRARRWVQIVMYPGLQLQRLTTREPDLDELAVSIAALQSVLEVERPGESRPEELLGLEVVA